MRRTSPGAAALAAWIALALSTLAVAPRALAVIASGGGREAPSWLAAWSAWSSDTLWIWLAAALAVIVAGRVASRGLASPGAIASDSRCVYVIVRGRERRIPRSTLGAVVLRARAREVAFEASSRVFHVELPTADEARGLARALDPELERPRPAPKIT